MAEKSGHPAIRDTFLPHSLRGRKPAHPDHGGPKGGGDYESGGATGFNHQDEFGDGGGHDIPAQHHEGGTTEGTELGMHKGSNATEGGQDFTVPPHRSRK